MGTGQFIWFDLMTPETEAAKRFYGDVVGWRTAQFGGGGDYEIWQAQGEGVGGLMKPKGAGLTPHWIGYVWTADVDETTRRAQSRGAEVHAPPTDIANTGRFSVLTDPQGAFFALFTPNPSSSSAGGGPRRQRPGQFAWAELNTTDWKKAWGFYAELFGWKATTSMQMPEGWGEYFMFSTTGGAESDGGMSNAATMMKMPPHWLHYITVKNTDEAVKLVTRGGGKVINGPMDVPGGGRIAQCLDPQGALFALHSQRS